MTQSKIVTCLIPILTLITICCHVQTVYSENILVVAFMGSKSHKNAFEPLYTELARRGHKLTVIHPIKSGYTDKNIKEINGPTFESLSDKSSSEPPNLFDMRMKNIKARTPIHPIIVPLLKQVCADYYEMPEVQAVMKQKFALVILSSHMNECAYGFVHKLNTSYIFVHPLPVENYKSIFTGFRAPASFVPSYAVGGITDDLSFFDRTLNYVAYKLTTALYEWYYLPNMESLYRKYVGEDTPSVREIEANASLMLNNAHFSLTLPRPQMPQVIDVGGMHCQPGKPLPKDLADFIDSSGSEGFILFSMGSHVKGSQMPADILQSFISAFTKIKQKIIWKFDLDKIEGLPSNVKLVKWAPQQDLLAHPKIRIFISHGGLLSMEESVYHGVPLIGVPLFGDQDWNMHQAESRGYGVILELKDLNTEQIMGAINKVLTDKRYAVAAKKIGRIFQDRQADAVQTAAYWAEYVIRHQGAIHLRSPAINLNCISYNSLDVIAFLTIVIFLSFYIPIMLCKMCCRRSNNGKEVTSKKRPNTRGSKKSN